MACVYLTMSEFSAGKDQKQRWSNSWGLETSGSIFTHIFDNWCWLWSELGWSSGIITHCLSIWPGLPQSLWPQGSKTSSTVHQRHLSKLTRQKLHHLLWHCLGNLKVSLVLYSMVRRELQRDSRGGELDFTSWWGGRFLRVLLKVHSVS